MGIIDCARKVLNRQSQRHARVFGATRASMEAVLDRLGEPRDDEERSFLQYKAQRSQARLLFVLYNAASLPLYYLQRRKLAAAYERLRLKAPEPYELVYYIYDADRSLMPASLLEAYPEGRHYYAENTPPSLNAQDLKLLAEIGRKRPFAFYYRLKILMRLGINRSLLTLYRPRIIAQCGEYSFASTICTQQLEAEGTAHYNLLHGEKLFSLRDAYPRFTKFYVWNEHYRRLFIAMRCPPEQFVTELPPGLAPRSLPYAKTVDATYYLANETGELLRRLVDSVQALAAAGRVIRLRPHPRYTDRAELAKLIPAEWIEPPELPLEASLGHSRAAISLYSTVLNQAAACGLEVVIDDLKAPELFVQLAELGYLRIHAEHTRLSEYLQRVRGSYGSGGSGDSGGSGPAPGRHAS